MRIKKWTAQARTRRWFVGGALYNAPGQGLTIMNVASVNPHQATYAYFTSSCRLSANMPDPVSHHH